MTNDEFIITSTFKSGWYVCVTILQLDFLLCKNYHAEVEFNNFV